MQLNQKIGVKYPTKTNINLAVHEAKSVDRRKLLSIGSFIAVCLLAFTKLGILDLLSTVDMAEETVQQTQGQLDQIKEANSIYDEVLKQYNESVSLSISSPVIATLSERLDIVNEYLISKAKVESFNVLDDVITAQISGVTLNQVSEIYTALMANEFVSNIQFYTASTEGDGGSLTTATLTIILTSKEGLETEQTEGGEGQ